MSDLLSIRMRASAEGSHISGAERIVRKTEIDAVTAELVQRALTHESGRPDSVTISVECIDPRRIISLPALPIKTIEVSNHVSGRKKATEELLREGVTETAAEAAIKAIIEGAAAPGRNMRGAMIVDSRTGERLETERESGLRARHMDYHEDFLPELVAALRERGLDNTHLKEALALATKVAGAPFAVAELCISDDPGYLTGYVASRANGYIRITRMKEYGDPMGGRAFFVDGSKFELQRYLEYMRETPVLVTGWEIPPVVLSPGLKHTGAGSVEGPTFDFSPIKFKLTVDSSAAPQNDTRSLPHSSLIGNLINKSLYRKLRTVESHNGIRAVSEGKPCTLFCTNDYLGLKSHPKVLAAAEAAIKDAGSGSGSAPLIAGHSRFHHNLQDDLARFKGAESSVLFGSGYLANVGILQSLAGEGGIIFSDELNHASIIDGCRLSRAEVRIYRHCDIDSLERALESSPVGAPKLVVTEGVFSMDGDIASMPEIIELARKHGARVVIDEAHATGTIGESGRGTLEHFGLSTEGLIQMGTLGKALGSYGAFAAADNASVDWLVNSARSFIFSTALPPAACAAASAALEVIKNEPERLQSLRGNADSLRSSLKGLGYAVLGEGTPIIPVVIGPAEETLKLASRLLDAGFYAPAIRPPTVPAGKCRIRLTVSALHSSKDIEALVDAFRKA